MSDHLTPPRRPSSMQRVSRWAMAQLWMSKEPGRSVKLTVDSGGLRATVTDESGRERFSYVLESEEPSAAVLRAMTDS